MNLKNTVFNDLDSALNWLNNKKRIEKRYHLEDMRDALSLLGNPHKDYKTIHVGGTNGKGSTSITLMNILKEAGYKCGLYISPFVIEFNERIEINGTFINNNTILEYINYIYEFLIEFEKSRAPLGFFEVTTLIAFKYFSDSKVDIAVIEVGLGGRLDATNVIEPLVSLVTNIQKDHMDQLGSTYKKILNEKLGIVKYKTPFITSIDRLELIPIIKNRCLDMASPLKFIRNIKNVRLDYNGTRFTYNGEHFKTSLIGFHQSRNTSLAIEAIYALNHFYDFNITKDIIDRALLNVKWPGRFEIIGENVILDGGHNAEGVESLKRTIKAYTAKDVITVFCAMKDKEKDKMIEEIESFSKRVIFTEIDYYRSEKAKNLIKLSHNGDNIVIENYKDAIKFALKGLKKDEIVLFNGSLYFISKVRKYFMEEGKC